MPSLVEVYKVSEKGITSIFIVNQQAEEAASNKQSNFEHPKSTF
jgi:hypothetical protein